MTTRIEGDAYIDSRMGFRVAVPEGMGQPRDITPSEIRSIASLVLVEGPKQTNLLVLALFLGSDHIDENELIRIMWKSVGLRWMGVSSLDGMQASEGEFQRIEMRVYTRERRGRINKIEIVRRAQTIYALVSRAPAKGRKLDSSCVELL